MTAQRFYEILGDIDEKNLKDAEQPPKTKKHLQLKYIVAMVACFVAIVVIGINLRERNPYISNPSNDESSGSAISVEQKDVNIYYLNGDELAYKAEYMECLPETVFASWKKANNIGEDVKLINVEIKSNGQENNNSTDSSIAGYSVGDQFIMEVTLTESIKNYFSVKSEEKLMESLRLTLTGYIYIDCDEFYVLYE